MAAIAATFAGSTSDSPNFDLEQTLKIVQEKRSVRIPNGNFFEVAGDPVGYGEKAEHGYTWHFLRKRR